MNNIQFIHQLNEALITLHQMAEKINVTADRFGNFSEGNTGSIFEKVRIRISDLSISGKTSHDAPKGTFFVYVNQLATPSIQEGSQFSYREKWENAVGKVGSSKVKVDSEFKIYFVDDPTKSLVFKPIKELHINDKDWMEDILERLVMLINDKAERENIPFKAYLSFNPIDPYNTKMLVITSKENGLATNFNIVDTKGIIADKLGIKKASAIYRYKKGKNCEYTIDDKKYESAKNGTFINDGYAELTFLERSPNGVKIDFVTEKRGAMNEVKNFLKQLNVFMLFLKNNREYIRGDVYHKFDQLCIEQKELFKEVGINYDSEVFFDWNEETLGKSLEDKLEEVKYLFFDHKKGIAWMIYYVSNKITTNPFGVYANEEHNPFIQKWNPRSIRNFRI